MTPLHRRRPLGPGGCGSSPTKGRDWERRRTAGRRCGRAKGRCHGAGTGPGPGPARAACHWPLGAAGPCGGSARPVGRGWGPLRVTHQGRAGEIRKSARKSSSGRRDSAQVTTQLPELPGFPLLTGTRRSFTRPRPTGTGTVSSHWQVGGHVIQSPAADAPRAIRANFLSGGRPQRSLVLRDRPALGHVYTYPSPSKKSFLIPAQVTSPAGLTPGPGRMRAAAGLGRRRVTSHAACSVV